MAPNLMQAFTSSMLHLLVGGKAYPAGNTAALGAVMTFKAAGSIVILKTTTVSLCNVPRKLLALQCFCLLGPGLSVSFLTEFNLNLLSC